MGQSGTSWLLLYYTRHGCCALASPISWRVMDATSSPPPAEDPASIDLLAEFRQAMTDCRDLYRDCALETIQAQPAAAKPSPEAFLNRMLDLHRGLLVKVLVTLSQADLKLSSAECELAAELVYHVWNKRLADRKSTRLNSSH